MFRLRRPLKPGWICALEKSCARRQKKSSSSAADVPRMRPGLDIVDAEDQDQDVPEVVVHDFVTRGCSILSYYSVFRVDEAAPPARTRLPRNGSGTREAYIPPFRFVPCNAYFFFPPCMTSFNLPYFFQTFFKI